jgi:hypothetical protein
VSTVRIDTTKPAPIINEVAFLSLMAEYTPLVMSDGTGKIFVESTLIVNNGIWTVSSGLIYLTKKYSVIAITVPTPGIYYPGEIQVPFIPIPKISSPKLFISKDSMVIKVTENEHRITPLGQGSIYVNDQGSLSFWSVKFPTFFLCCVVNPYEINTTDNELYYYLCEKNSSNAIIVRKGGTVFLNVTLPISVLSPFNTLLYRTRTGVLYFYHDSYLYRSVNDGTIWTSINTNVENISRVTPNGIVFKTKPPRTAYWLEAEAPISLGEDSQGTDITINPDDTSDYYQTISGIWNKSTRILTMSTNCFFISSIPYGSNTISNLLYIERILYNGNTRELYIESNNSFILFEDSLFGKDYPQLTYILSNSFIRNPLGILAYNGIYYGSVYSTYVGLYIIFPDLSIKKIAESPFSLRMVHWNKVWWTAAGNVYMYDILKDSVTIIGPLTSYPYINTGSTVFATRRTHRGYSVGRYYASFDDDISPLFTIVSLPDFIMLLPSYGSVTSGGVYGL